jgi:hypothetical protein
VTVKKCKHSKIAKKIFLLETGKLAKIRHVNIQNRNYSTAQEAK